MKRRTSIQETLRQALVGCICLIGIGCNAAKGQIDVYSIPKLQRKTQTQGAMASTHFAFTRYKIQSNGSLEVHRIVSVVRPKLSGVTQDRAGLSLKVWTPMKGVINIFDGHLQYTNSE
ncbi:hypothetical protein LAG90_08895 [Marinilongibacter aquaticus]|uniref:hypothetical protein n=1 Tax=Marinilongibacter aquaticus TaxID=2975157 RepID=UPI0021BDDF9A|nr:hypothetical protein [Marinilongibacter aquaticus]UBM60750.1 hypothetical protein LAG90_08895 [Marinilongibacter aquaticus]